jgi:uncharacterized protein (DUF1501 family)
MMNRREFLKAITLASSAPLWVRLGPLAGGVAEAATSTPDRMLLVLYLAGGNDGLNTIVPYTDSLYTKARPTIGLKADEVYPLGADGRFGMHKSLVRVQDMWHNGQVAIVHNVGYPNPNFSHFESTYIWETASPEQRFHTGWLGRYLDATDTSSRGPVRAIAVGQNQLPRTLISNGHPGVALNRLSDFTFADETRPDAALRRRAFRAFGAGSPADGSMRAKVIEAQDGTIDAVTAVSGAAKQVKTALTPAQTVATMFGAGVGTEIGFIYVGGFDTHTTQRGQHANILGLVDKAIAQFFDQAATLGLADRATVITFSDFGRRVGENASNGTDHGSSMPVLVMGPRVNGGFYGTAPDLGVLVDGNLDPSVHMGSVYGSVLAGAFNVDPAPILGGDYPLIPLIN